MGSPFQDYQQAQTEAEYYAKTQRRIRRYGMWYVVASVISLLLTALIAPKLLIPSLIFSVSCYTLFRFGSWAYTKAKHWYLDRQAQRAISGRDGPSEEPLLSARSRTSLRDMAHNEITQALIHKQARIAHYATDATFSDAAPISYNDRKHQRALFQYRMLERTKEAALLGDESFIEEVKHDKTEHRQRKIDILNTILNDFLLNQKVSISLRSVGQQANDDEWIIAGENSRFLDAIENWNSNGPKPFLPIPPGLSKPNKEKFLSQSLLPLLLDRDQILGNTRPIKGKIVGVRFGMVINQRTYAITADYVKERIGGLEKPRNSSLRAAAASEA